MPSMSNVTRLKTKAEREAEVRAAEEANEDSFLLEEAYKALQSKEEAPLRMTVEEFLNSPRLP